MNRATVHLRRWHWVIGAVLAVAAGLVALVVNSHRDPARQANRPGNPAPVDIPTAALIAATSDNQSILPEADAARTANAALAIVPNALEPSRAFSGPADPLVQSTAEQCLAQAIYYEAGFEGEVGRRAVAQVVLNRVRHPAFPHSVCGVVYQRTAGVCQFTFACDGALARTPVPALWARSLREAREALAGRVEPAVGMATHYHADYVYPAWAPRLEKVAAIGQHLFYRWPMGWGRRKAFTAGYAGVEPGVVPVPLATETGGADAAMIPSGENAGEIAPRRSQNDAGYVDTSKGWRPSIADVESEAAAGTPSPPPQ